jgi:hypothetical protein
MDIAVTVDELLLWDGTPMPPGYTPDTVLKGYPNARRANWFADVIRDCIRGVNPVT